MVEPGTAGGSLAPVTLRPHPYSRRRSVFKPPPSPPTIHRPRGFEQVARKRQSIVIGRRWPVGSTSRPVGLSAPSRPWRIGWRLASQSRPSETSPLWDIRRTLVHSSCDIAPCLASQFELPNRRSLSGNWSSVLRLLNYPSHVTLARYEKIHVNPLLKELRVLQDPGRVTLSFDRICIFEGEHSVLWLAPE